MKKIVVAVVLCGVLIAPYFASGSSTSPKNYLYKEFYYGMPQQEAYSLLADQNPKMSEGQITYFNEKFSGHDYFVFLDFDKNQLSQVTLMISERESRKVSYIVHDFLDAMNKNNFITCFFVDGENYSIAPNKEVISNGIRGRYLRFMAFEIETIQKVPIYVSKLDDFYEILKKYPQNNRMIDFTYSNDITCITFMLFKDELKFVKQIFESRSQKPF